MPITDELLTPIEGDDLVGPSLRYDPVYDRIKGARKEDPLQDPPVRADWALVEKLTRAALAERSKDLWIAAWLSEARLHRNGIPGLHEGLELVQGLLEHYWDDIHPQADDGDLGLRAAPLSWIGAYLDVPVRLAPLNADGHGYLQYRASLAIPSESEAESDSEKKARRQAALAEGRLDPESFEAAFAKTPKPWYKELVGALDASLQRVHALTGFCDERFGEEAPTFRTLREALEEVQGAAGALLARKLELEPDPVQSEADMTEAGSAEAVGPGSTSQVTVLDAPALDAAPTSRDAASGAIAAAARYLRQDRPHDPAPYLLLRGFRWGELRAGRGTVDPRLLAAPPTELRTRLKSLLLDGSWAELLERGEEVMATPFGRGWLDLQRYVCTALEGLGAEYAGVAQSVRGAIQSLLRDLPELVDATLMDDSPTANRETVRWLSGQGLISSGEHEADADRSPSIEPAAPLESAERILHRLGTSQPQRAIELLMRSAEREKSERARFLRRADATRVMVESGLEAVAEPILRRMFEQIERHQLEDWEAGQTVAGTLGLLYRCMDRLGKDPAEREALYLRICRLDPMQAIQFEHDDGGDASSDEVNGQPAA